MARPPKKNAEYVSHYADVRNLKEIRALRSRYGPEGYGVYWMILETLTGLDDHRLEWCNLERELVAGDIGIEPEYLFNLVTYGIVLRLFYLEEVREGDVISHYLKSHYIDDKLSYLYDKREADRARLLAKKAEKAATKKEEDLPESEVIAAITPIIETITPIIATNTTQRKEKESKAKEEDINIKIEEEILSEERNEFKELQNSLLNQLVKFNNQQLKEWEASAQRCNIDVVTLQKQFCNTVIADGLSLTRTQLIAKFDRYLITTITRKQNERKRDKASNGATKRGASKTGRPIANDTSQPKAGYKL
jgi:hypothetical protein